MAIHLYGKMPRKVRKRWAPKVRAGIVDCARCGKPILSGEKWDLDHDDDDPSHGAISGRRTAAATGRS
jgi:hypothetical protein